MRDKIWSRKCLLHCKNKCFWLNFILCISKSDLRLYILLGFPLGCNAGQYLALHITPGLWQTGNFIYLHRHWKQMDKTRCQKHLSESPSLISDFAYHQESPESSSLLGINIQGPHRKNMHISARKPEGGESLHNRKNKRPWHDYCFVSQSLTYSFASYWDSHMIVARDCALTCIILHGYDELEISFTSIATTNGRIKEYIRSIFMHL